MPRAVDLRPEKFDVSHDPTQQLSPDTGLEQLGGPIDELGKLLGEFPRRLIETLLGIAEDPIPEVAQWVANVPGLSQIVKALTGIPGTIEQLGQAFANLREFLTIDINAPDFDPQAAAQHFVAAVVQPFIKVISQIRAALLGPLPIGLLTNDTPTLLLEGGFDEPITIVEGSGFFHDATDGVPGTSPLGCARAECDGTHKQTATALLKVGPGWALKLGGRVKYENLVAGANALRINLLPYADENTPWSGGAVMVATAGTVSGTSGGDGGWGTTPIEGTWTVPLTGVQYVAVEVHVTDAATAGVAKYDEVYLLATQLIPQIFTKDLPEDLLTLWNGLGGLVEQMLTRLGLPVLGNFWDQVADLTDELELIQERAAQGIQDAAEALNDLATLAGNLLNNPAAVLGQIGQELVENLEDDLAEAGDAIGDVFDDVRDGWNRFWDGIFRTSGSTGKTALDVQTAAESISTAVDQVQNNTESLASTILLPRTKSLWESKWPQDDVSFPVFNIDGYTTPTLGRLYLIPVTASSDREYQSLKFAIQGTSMTSCYVGVYTIDTATGQATLISNLGDVKSSLSGSVEQQSLALPESISAAKGQTFYVGVLQVGGTAAGMKRSSLTDTMTDYPTSHPQFFGNIVTGSFSSLPSSITAANITVSTRFWAALGYGVSPPPPPKLYFSDPFNRADGDLGSNYIARKKYNVGLVISGNTVRTGDTGAGVHSAVPKFTTNNQGVRMTTPTDNDAGTGLFLRASNSMMVGFILGTQASEKRIVTCPGFDIGNNAFNNCTTRATSSNPFPGPPASSYITEFTAVGNVYTAKWTNGTGGFVTLTWTDTGGIVPIGAGQREAAIAIDYDSSSSYIDNFEMWDI
ncbi:hypothetical protein [Mycolicibacterium mageritense]|uniref:hypothetical protein n=1 Tax=Mycolicibacterium mageritense TaxID=53462 RepID=UPI001E60BB1D|nr:hypothetical protein [Mycolicibacterium mageritense]MCC9181071.1 hypothetical protein [Mycolicibacterium mageritense]